MEDKSKSPWSSILSTMREQGSKDNPLKCTIGEVSSLIPLQISAYGTTLEANQIFINEYLTYNDLSLRDRVVVIPGDNGFSIVCKVKSGTYSLENAKGNEALIDEINKVKDFVDELDEMFKDFVEEKKTDDELFEEKVNDIIKDLEDRLDLEIISEEIYEKTSATFTHDLNKFVSEFKYEYCKKTDLANATNTINATVTEIKDKQSKLEQNIDGFKTDVSAIYATKTEITNMETGLKESITEVSKKQSDFEQSVDGFKTDVSATYATKTEVTDMNTGLTTSIEEIERKQSGMQQTVDGFETKVSDIKTTADSALEKATTAQQTAEGFNQTITEKLNNDYYNKVQIDTNINGISSSVSNIQTNVNTTINKIELLYYLSSSETQLIGGEWSTTAPKWTDGKYMWTKTKTYFVDTTKEPTESPPTCISGAIGPQGIPGKDGTSVTILGSYNTYEELIAAHPTGNNNGDGYIIQGDLWVWDGTKFKNVGKIQGKDGIDGTDGVNGQDGTSIIWKGTYSSHPASPQNGWAYYNSTDKKSYVYQSNTWYQMTIDGTDGIDGNDGVDGLSIEYKGELVNPPLNPQKNWTYKDTDNGIVYIYTGTAWEVLTYDGSDGEDGTNGTNGLSVFITYHDSRTQPTKPTGNGTTNGWHTNCTTSVVWISQKISDSATTGTWGEPIKIKGDDGQGIVSITLQYNKSTNGTTAPSENDVWWQNTVPAWQKKTHLWIRSKILYTNPPSTVYTTPYLDAGWESANTSNDLNENTTTKLSEFNQTLDGFGTRVTSAENKAGEALNSSSEAVQTADTVSTKIKEVETNVTNLDTRVATAESTLTTSGLTTVIGSYYTTSAEVDKKVEETKTQIDKEITDVSKTVTDLNTYVDGAFKDGIIDETEKEVLRKQLEELQKESEDVLSQVDSIASAIELKSTTELTDLNAKKTNYNNAYTALVAEINKIIGGDI